MEANAGGAGLGANQLGGVPGMNNSGTQSPGALGNRNSANQRGGSFGSQRQGQTNSRNSTSGFGSRSNSSRTGAGSGFGSRTGAGTGRGAGSGNGSDEEEPSKIRFMRRIPVDPMTGRPEWGMRSVSDPPEAMTWGGDNVFDVFSLSLGSSLDGELYSEW